MDKEILAVCLVGFILAGLLMTYLGAKDVYEKQVLSRDWIEMEATYAGNEPYENSDNGPAYWLYSS